MRVHDSFDMNDPRNLEYSFKGGNPIKRTYRSVKKRVKKVTKTAQKVTKKVASKVLPDKVEKAATRVLKSTEKTIKNPGRLDEKIREEAYRLKVGEAPETTARRYATAAEESSAGGAAMWAAEAEVIEDEKKKRRKIRTKKRGLKVPVSKVSSVGLKSTSRAGTKL